MTHVGNLCYCNDPRERNSARLLICRAERHGKLATKSLKKGGFKMYLLV